MSIRYNDKVEGFRRSVEGFNVLPGADSQ